MVYGKDKKAEIAFSQIVLAVIAIIVVIVLIMIFSGRMSDSNDDLESCALHGGICKSDQECQADQGTVYKRGDIKVCGNSGEVCCISLFGDNLEG